MNLTTNKELNDKIVTLITKVNNLDKKFDKFQKSFVKLTKVLEGLVTALEED